jgi:post-segregation antitoxin (ccd killing protein)
MKKENKIVAYYETKEEKQKVVNMAKEVGISVSALIKMILKKELKKQEAKNGIDENN